MRETNQLTTARQALAVLAFLIVIAVDLGGDPETNPPPEPIRTGREAWEL